MEQEVYSQDEAMEWFLGHSSGSVTCVDGDRSKSVDCYPDAIKFFKDL